MDGYEDLLPLLADLDEDELQGVVEGLPEGVVASLLTSLSDQQEKVPEGPAQQALQLDEGYVIRPHTAYISERLAKAKRAVQYSGQSRKIIIETPPRVGKSTLVSVYFPLWIMRQHPWKIALISYDSGLTTDWARQIRTAFEEAPHFGVTVNPDGGAASRWSTSNGASIRARSTGQALTGTGAKVLLIDDPVKDFATAHSPTMRESLWNWWLSVAQTRLEPPSLVVVTMCMTGDTPVLRPDGTEIPLRDIRPGDEIATYEDGALTTSTVVNWMSQGYDQTYRISMKSGAEVRANARHPFLTVDENGVERWQRTDTLRPGTSILRATGESGAGSPAARTAAMSPRRSRPDATGTTASTAGRRATGLPRTIPRTLERFDSEGGMASSPRSTTDGWLSRKVAALSAAELLRRQDSRSTGPTSSASTTTTSPERSEDSSATTATSSSGEPGTTPPSSDDSLATWRVSADEIVEVVRTGLTEEVFDLQVERTENFIANGLVSHNTRWHEDDLVGRLLSPEYEGDPDEWEVIRLPALAEGKDDLLGRSIGEPLLSPIIDETVEEATERWENTRVSVGTQTFAAMYQQRPAPAKGAIFDTDWWRFWTRDSSKATDDGRVVYLDPSTLTGSTWLDSWDCTFVKGNSNSGDYVVGQRWVRNKANRYLIAQQRGRWSFTETLEKMERWSGDDPVLSPHGRLVHRRLVENKANGPAILDVLQDKIAGLKPVNPKTSKEARAQAVTPEIESGNVYLPLPSDPGNEWVYDFLSEVRNFPHDLHDDQVDALTQALSELRDPGRGGVTVPGNQGNLSRVPRSLASAAASDLNKHRIRR